MLPGQCFATLIRLQCIDVAWYALIDIKLLCYVNSVQIKTCGSAY